MGGGTRLLLVVLLVTGTTLRTHGTRHAKDTTNLKEFFTDLLNKLSQTKAIEDKDKDEDQSLLINEEDDSDAEFKRATRGGLLRCKLMNLCHCRSKMTGRNFCCDCAAGPCFPGDSRVIIDGGNQIDMDQLAIGNRVLAALDNGELVYSKVVAFLDRRPRGDAEYLELQTQSGSVVTISSNHVIYTWSSIYSAMETRFAKEVSPGDYLFVVRNNSMESDQVIAVRRRIKTGAYVPLTEHGNIVVDNVLASCYSSFDHSISHFFLTPVRWFAHLLMQDERPNGILTYVTWSKAIGNLLFHRQLSEVEIIQQPILPSVS